MLSGPTWGREASLDGERAFASLRMTMRTVARCASSLRRHSRPGVEADHRAVEHRVLDDRQAEMRIFLGLAEALVGEYLAREQRGAHVLGHRIEQRRLHVAGCDRHHADAVAA